jgi:hypothetical protein
MSKEKDLYRLTRYVKHWEQHLTAVQPLEVPLSGGAWYIGTDSKIINDELDMVTGSAGLQPLTRRTSGDKVWECFGDTGISEEDQSKPFKLQAVFTYFLN